MRFKEFLNEAYHENDFEDIAVDALQDLGWDGNNNVFNFEFYVAHTNGGESVRMDVMWVKQQTQVGDAYDGDDEVLKARLEKVRKKILNDRAKFEMRGQEALVAIFSGIAKKRKELHVKAIVDEKNGYVIPLSQPITPKDITTKNTTFIFMRGS